MKHADPVRKERRKYQRYETEAKIRFHLKYDLKTKVSFKLLKQVPEAAKEYKGVTRNVSVEGLGFSSHKRLKKGDRLYLELYLPEQDRPICMTGEVRWSKRSGHRDAGELAYETGVKISTLGLDEVARSIYFDEQYNVYWSNVLNAVFGSFKRSAKEISKKIIAREE